jgi:uncharacterized protein
MLSSTLRIWALVAAALIAPAGLTSSIAVAQPAAKSAPAQAAPTPAPSKEALEAADKLMAAQDMDAMMKDMTSNMSAQLPPQLRDSFVNEMNEPAFLGRMKAQMRMAMAKHMTIEELNAMAEFYARPIAKSAMKKIGVYMAEVMPFMQTEMMTMAQRLMQQQQQKK